MPEDGVLTVRAFEWGFAPDAIVLQRGDQVRIVLANEGEILHNLEVEELEHGRLRVDFNYSYNPYCAYNDAWSCPIPPAENRLAVPIRAGERTFEADH